MQAELKSLGKPFCSVQVFEQFMKAEGTAWSGQRGLKEVGQLSSIATSGVPEKTGAALCLTGTVNRQEATVLYCHKGQCGYTGGKKSSPRSGFVKAQVLWMGL